MRKKVKNNKVTDSFLKEIVEKMNFKKPIPKKEREKQIEKFLSLLKELWLITPEQRFAQVLYNYTKMGTLMQPLVGPSEGLKDFFYYEDGEILKDIKKAIKDNRGKLQKLNKKS